MGNLCGLERDKKVKGDFHFNLVHMYSTDNLQEEFVIVDSKPLGEGITGSVYKVRSKVSGEQYAMKSINLSRYNKAQLRELENEIDLIRDLDHPNIIKIYRVYKSKKSIYIIMEMLTGGELSSRFPETKDEIISIATQLLSACRYWHSRNIVHRDLKLENIMFTSMHPKAPIKVIDFGLGTWFAVNHGSNINAALGADSGRSTTSQDSYAKKRPSSKISAGSLTKKLRFQKSGSIRREDTPPTSQNGSHRRSIVNSNRLKRIMMSQVGTAYFMAPEVGLERGYDQAIDLWAIGVIIYMMVTRKEPFGGQSEQEIFSNAAKATPKYDSPNWQRLPEAKELVQNLLELDPAKRWTAEQALKSPFLNSKKRRQKKEVKFANASNPEDEDFIMEKEIVNSFQRFVKYTKLKRAALMVIAHKANSEKLAKLREIFLEMDIYHTGTITLEELRIALEGHGIVGDQVTALFNDLDQDRSGHIRYMEFLAATIETQKFISAEELSDAFDHFDTDKSGYITKKNLKELLGKEFTSQEVEAIIKESDLTGDSQVSRAEFMQVMSLNHDRLLRKTLADDQSKQIPEENVVRALLSNGNSALEAVDAGKVVVDTEPAETQDSDDSRDPSSLDTEGKKISYECEKA